MVTTDGESNAGQTTLEPTRYDDGRLRATQPGVAIGGYGKTGAHARRTITGRRWNYHTEVEGDDDDVRWPDGDGDDAATVNAPGQH